MISAIFSKNNKLFKGNEDDFHKILAGTFSVSYELVGRFHLDKIVLNNLCLNYVRIKKDL